MNVVYFDGPYGKILVVPWVNLYERMYTVFLFKKIFGTLTSILKLYCIQIIYILENIDLCEILFQYYKEYL